MQPSMPCFALALSLLIPAVTLGQEAQSDPDWARIAADAHPLDLETRSLLAIQAMQNTIDPEKSVPWIMAYLTPSFRLDVPTAMLAGKYLDGLIMARTITGSNVGEPAEKKMRYAVLNAFVDGLSSGTIQGDLGSGVKRKTSVELAGHKHLLPSLLTLHRLDPEDRRLPEALTPVGRLTTPGATARRLRRHICSLRSRLRIP